MKSKGVCVKFVKDCPFDKEADIFYLIKRIIGNL